MSEDDPEESRGVSRRALFGLGVRRALDELPVGDRRRRQSPAQPRRPNMDELRDGVTATGTAFDGQLAPVADIVADAAAIEPATSVLEVGPGWVELGAAIVARGGSFESTTAPEFLPFEDGSFDRVVSAFGVAWMGRRPAVISELFRVVRPGGSIVLACWTRSSFMGAALATIAAAALPGDAEDPTVWGRQERMRQDLGLYAGDDVDFERRVVGLEFPTIGTAWASFTRLPAPIGSAIAALDEPEREALEEEFTQLLPHGRMGGPVSPAVQFQLIAARAV